MFLLFPMFLASLSLRRHPEKSAGQNRCAAERLLALRFNCWVSTDAATGKTTPAALLL
jgi:hypothetical protein